MKNKLMAIMILGCVILAGANVVLKGMEDLEAPEIEFGEETITYTEGSDRTALLADVKAIDNRDDDVSATLQVEKIYPSDDLQTAQVIYVAKDESNNVAKRARVVNYTVDAGAGAVGPADSFIPVMPADSPKIALSEARVVVPVGTPFDPMAYVQGLEDDQDSSDELSENIQILGSEYVNTSQQGIYHLIYFATDSDGNRSNEALLTVEVH